MEYLVHHGILGQKWGVRRFQDKNGRLTAAGRKRYDVDGKTKNDDKKGLTEKQKKLLIYGGITAAVFVGGYAAYKTGAFDKKIIDKGKAIVDNGVGGSLQNLPYPKITTPHDRTFDMSVVNRSNKGLTGSDSNCLMCSIAYELRRRGYDVMASLNIDKFSGLVRKDGRSIFELEKVFKNAKITQESLNDWNELSPLLSKQGDKARGILRIEGPQVPGHFINYEIIGGKLTLSDAQNSVVYPISFMKNFNPSNIMFLRTDNLDIGDLQKLSEFVEDFV